MHWQYHRPESDGLICSTGCKETWKDFSRKADNPSLYPLKESIASVSVGAFNKGISKALLYPLHHQRSACHSDLGSNPTQTHSLAGAALGKSQLGCWDYEGNGFGLSGPLAESDTAFKSPGEDPIISVHYVSGPSCPPPDRSQPSKGAYYAQASLAKGPEFIQPGP